MATRDKRGREDPRFPLGDWPTPPQYTNRSWFLSSNVDSFPRKDRPGVSYNLSFVCTQMMHCLFPVRGTVVGSSTRGDITTKLEVVVLLASVRHGSVINMPERRHEQPQVERENQKQCDKTMGSTAA